MPQTIARSDKQAQGIWSRAYTRAAKQHGEGRKAERVAYDALKETYEKKGDRWVKKSRESEA
jgi:cation transport regulator ChaB